MIFSLLAIGFGKLCVLLICEREFISDLSTRLVLLLEQTELLLEMFLRSLLLRRGVLTDSRSQKLLSMRMSFRLRVQLTLSWMRFRWERASGPSSTYCFISSSSPLMPLMFIYAYSSISSRYSSEKNSSWSLLSSESSFSYAGQSKSFQSFSFRQISWFSCYSDLLFYSRNLMFSRSPNSFAFSLKARWQSKGQSEPWMSDRMLIFSHQMRLMRVIMMSPLISSAFLGPSLCSRMLISKATRYSKQWAGRVSRYLSIFLTMMWIMSKRIMSSCANFLVEHIWRPQRACSFTYSLPPKLENRPIIGLYSFQQTRYSLPQQSFVREPISPTVSNTTYSFSELSSVAKVSSVGSLKPSRSQAVQLSTASLLARADLALLTLHFKACKRRILASQTA